MSRSFIKETNNLMIVDAFNLAFRYKDTEKPFVEDYIKTISSLGRSYDASRIILAADKGVSSYRSEIFPEYKANRTEKYSDQSEEEANKFKQFLQEYRNALTEASNKWELLRFDNTEADDIAAYIVSKKELENKYKHIWLISSDKDWDLLVNHFVSRFSFVTRKETTLDNWVDHYDFDKEYLLSFKCLNGDPGDNINGVEGVGKARANQLFQVFGKIDSLLDSLPLPSSPSYYKSVNVSRDTLYRNLQLIDLVSFCRDALGDNTETIDKLLEI